MLQTGVPPYPGAEAFSRPTAHQAAQPVQSSLTKLCVGSCAAGASPNACSLLELTGATSSAPALNGYFYQAGSCNGKPVYYGYDSDKKLHYNDNGRWMVVADDEPCGHTSGWMISTNSANTPPLPDMINPNPGSYWRIYTSGSWSDYISAKFTCYGAMLTQLLLSRPSLPNAHHHPRCRASN